MDEVEEFDFFQVLIVALLEQFITFVAGWFRTLQEGLF